MVSLITAESNPQYPPLGFNSSRNTHRCSARSVVDFLLFGDHGICYRSGMLHSYPELEIAYPQRSFDHFGNRGTVL